MADDTTLNPGTGGDVVRNIDKSGAKTQVVVIDLGGAGAEALLTGTLPVSIAALPVGHVIVDTAPETAVTGTFWQATQPISAASLPLPSDAATQTTLAALNGKVTAVNTGAVVISSGSVTANAGTNLNTSALATEAGNLATLTAKDFATQTTLAALNAKVTAVNTGAVVVSSSALPSGAATEAKQDTGNTHLATLAGAVSGAELQVDIVSMPAAASSATATEDAPEYTEGASEALSQDLAGNLRTLVSAVVSDVPPSYLTGSIEPLSINSEGRLRVSVVSADNYMEFFKPFDFGAPEDIYELSTSPWSALL